MPTLYTYALTPTALGCGVTANLSLTVVNSDVAQSGRQTISITVPSGTDAAALTASPALISVTASPSTNDAGWAGVLLNGPAGYTIKLQGPGLGTNQALAFSIDTVAVNSEPNPAVVLPVAEQFGAQGTGVLTLSKQFLDLSIVSFEPSPAYAAVPGRTDLVWTVEGGSYVMLLPLNVRRPTEGTGPFSDKYPVSITDGPATQFTLQLWTDNHQYVSANAVVYAGTVTATLSNSSSGAIDLDSPVTFTWNSAYAAPPLFLAPSPAGTTRVDPSGSITFSPGALLVDNSSSITVTLQANGWRQPATAKTTVFFNPVRILYLRYADSSKTSVIWGAKNYVARQTSLVLSDGLYTLTAVGPGGPIQQKLGPVPTLQVQLFTATPSAPNVGDTVTLSYETANATSVTINGESVPWDAATQLGSKTIQYAGPAILTMVATGAGGVTLSSELALPYAS